MLIACPPPSPQVSVINGTSPFAHDYDLAHIVAAYQERNGELPVEATVSPLRDLPGCRVHENKQLEHFLQLKLQTSRGSEMRGGWACKILSSMSCVLSSKPHPFPLVTSPVGEVLAIARLASFIPSWASLVSSY